jgi:ribosomal protein L11 methyltransferase
MGRNLKLLVARGANHVAIRQGAPYDLVLANILARPLVHLSPDIARLTRPGGHIILSGLLAHQEPQVKAAYSGQGLKLVRRSRLNGWSTLTYERSRSAAVHM